MVPRTFPRRRPLSADEREQGLERPWRSPQEKGFRGTAFFEVKEDGSSHMNTNRQNNNRRRGRGGNNRQQNNNNRNGYDFQNRVDNRARGNASQMLEKYKKLASDAQLNGDRVNAEYYLQFADHYFRVLADYKSRQEVRQEENNQQRRDRGDWQNDEGFEGEAVEAVESEEAEASEADTGEREERESRPRRERNDRNDRGNRQPRRHHSEEAADEVDGNVEGGLDLNVLPPSISLASDEDEPEAELQERPARKPRTRRPAPTANDDDVVDAAE